MYRQISLLAAGVSLMAATTFACAQEPTTSATASSAAATEVKTGSTAFCLYELPSDAEGKRRWVNLGIVQYLEFNRNELKIYYGGGNLGSGHEAKFPISNPAQLDETLNRIRQTAANCR